MCDVSQSEVGQLAVIADSSSSCFCIARCPFFGAGGGEGGLLTWLLNNSERRLSSPPGIVLVAGTVLSSLLSQGSSDKG